MVVNSVVDLPDYARAPGFHFNLGVLLRDKQKELLLNVSNTNEHENIIKVLKNESIIDSKGNKLDDTQARSLVSSLCKEIALIEAGIDNIVRLGGRSRSDKITPFNLEEIVRNRERPVGIEAYLLAQAYKSLDDIKKDADKIQNRLSQRWLTWNEISPYLSFEFAEHYSKFSYYHDDPEVPKFLLDNDNDNDMDIDDESSWKTAGSASRNKPVFEQSNLNSYGIFDNSDEFYYEFDVDDEYVEPIYDSMQSFLCGEKLECGHLCPYKCHFDNPDHINIFCRKECIKLHPECLHPCSKFCGEKCGDCSLVIGDIMLPSCGHLYPRAKCYETRNVDSILCHIKVSKTLPNCGHKLEVMCYESVDDIVCKQPCGELTKCEHINALEAAIRNLDNNRPNMLERFKSIRLYSTDNSKKNNIEGPDKIVPEVTIKEQFYQIGKYHSIPEQQTKLWQNHIKDLYKSYNQLTMIMAHTKNPPHKKAFDAALTRLYNEKSKVPIDVFNFENINIADDSVRFEQSLREVGLIAPQLDRRVYIDAFFEIVNAQKIMFHEVVRIISELPNTEVPHSEERQGYISVLATRKNWIGFCGRIIDSITNHLEKIFQTCEESKYGRHLVQASLELVEFEYQVGRFNLNNRMNPQISISEPIKREIIEKCNKIRKDCKKIQRDYLQKINLEYFQGQCEARIVKLLNDVNELQEKAENYGQLTREEKEQCKLAAAVGGGSHSLTSGNRRNVEFDTMGGTI
ncbi:3095_t:CDS:10 [Funneliformis caledonium]|uniref:3095_t:CDS:1 n=1 Tax=Funneliformis caledonium TaxID=1117310 RepID=A0A9N9BRD6_9GLOM|nr:3095_t:CDS:10 [Funneliformis caledonium]